MMNTIPYDIKLYIRDKVNNTFVDHINYCDIIGLEYNFKLFAEFNISSKNDIIPIIDVNNKKSIHIIYEHYGDKFINIYRVNMDHIKLFVSVSPKYKCMKFDDIITPDKILFICDRLSIKYIINKIKRVDKIIIVLLYKHDIEFLIDSNIFSKVNNLIVYNKSSDLCNIDEIFDNITIINDINLCEYNSKYLFNYCSGKDNNKYDGTSYTHCMQLELCIGLSSGKHLYIMNYNNLIVLVLCLLCPNYIIKLRNLPKLKIIIITDITYTLESENCANYNIYKCSKIIQRM